MSRSVKSPWYTDNGKHTVYFKKLFNRRIRRFQKYLLVGGQYKKLNNQWDIHDYRFYCPEDAKAYRK